MNLSDYWKIVHLRKYLDFAEFSRNAAQLNLSYKDLTNLQDSFLEGLLLEMTHQCVSIADDRMHSLAKEFTAKFWEQLKVNTQQRVPDEKLLEIAQNPLYAPVSAWWLNEGTKLDDVHSASLRFARAIEALVLQSESYLTDAEIHAVSQDPATTPVYIWWLRDHVNVGDVQQAPKVFARAVESQVRKLRTSENAGH